MVNLDTLSERFDEGTVVTPQLLREAGLIHSTRQPIKVLARGDVEEADRAGAQVQRQGGGEDSGGGRRDMLVTAAAEK